MSFTHYVLYFPDHPKLNKDFWIEVRFTLLIRKGPCSGLLCCLSCMSFGGPACSWYLSKEPAGRTNDKHGTTETAKYHCNYQRFCLNASLLFKLNFVLSHNDLALIRVTRSVTKMPLGFVSECLAISTLLDGCMRWKVDSVGYSPDHSGQVNMW